MKKRVIVIFLALSLVVTLPPVASRASPMVCFTGVNDTLLPFRDATMPAYFGTVLYVPAGVFAEFGISSGTSASRDNLYVYRGEKERLAFYISLELAMDQSGEIYENVGVKTVDGLYFLPLDFICEFFELTYKLLSNDPVSVLRIKNSDAVYNDPSFIGHYKNQIEQAYKAYSAPSTSTPVPSAPPAETPVIFDYSDVTVYLSFCGVTETYASLILSALSDYSVTACFFLSAADIAENPALVRRISGENHMVGIWLDSAELDEYSGTSRLLFEAAKLVTPLVASDIEISGDAAALCEEYGLLYRVATVWPEESNNAAAVASQLSVTPYTYDDIRFACTQNTSRILPTVLRYLNSHFYTVSLITETSPNIPAEVE